MLHPIERLYAFIVYGIGGGSRYIFFLLIGKKRLYKNLIEPEKQDKWNIIVSFIIIGISITAILYFDSEYGVDSEGRHAPVKTFIQGN